MENYCHHRSGARKHLSVKKRFKKLIAQSVSNELLPLMIKRDVAQLSFLCWDQFDGCTSVFLS